VKGALIAAIGSILLGAAVVAVSFLWPSGEPEGGLKNSELAWIGRYHQWEGGRSSCVSVPRAPTERLRRLAARARAACNAKDDSNAVNDAIWDHFFMSRSLPVSADAVTDSHVNASLGPVASRMAEQAVKVRCWSTEDWRRINREYSTAFPAIDYFLSGIADPYSDLIHLEGNLCRPLVRFFGTAYTPRRPLDRADLAEGLMVLAHEVEHIRDIHFSNSEAVIACYAVQRVRDLVRDEGRSAAFAADVAAYAWDVSYSGRDPDYHTKECRNGGPLDRRPTSDLWP
jgi:hypothetical protein